MKQVYKDFLEQFKNESRPYMIEDVPVFEQRKFDDGIKAATFAKCKANIAEAVMYAFSVESPFSVIALFSHLEESEKSLPFFKKGSDVVVEALLTRTTDGKLAMTALAGQDPAFIQDVVNILGEERFKTVMSRLEQIHEIGLFNQILGALDSLSTTPRERLDAAFTRRKAAPQTGSALNAPATASVSPKTPAPALAGQG